MATLKEWYRDFRRKPKWDQFSIGFTVIVGILGLFVVGNFTISFFSNNTIENPQFNITNSSNFGLNYKSPNSPITIIDRSGLSENCDPRIYNRIASFNFKNYFKSLQYENNQSLETPNLTYNLFNAEFILPSNQKLYLPEILSDKQYTVAYLNEDLSDACIVHKYQIPSNFDEGEVCFIFTLFEDSVETMQMAQGPKFIENKTSCFEKVSGDFDLLYYWNINI